MNSTVTHVMSDRSSDRTVVHENSQIFTYRRIGVAAPLLAEYRFTTITSRIQVDFTGPIGSSDYKRSNDPRRHHRTPAGT